MPHIRSGKTYYINVPALLRQLGVEDSKNTKEVRQYGKKS